MRVFVLFLILISMTANAELTVNSCLKGYKQAEQNQNLVLCEKQITANQVCSDKMFEHGNGAYDVCVLEIKNPTVVSCAKGFSNKDQAENLIKCKRNRGSGTLCVSSLWVHGQGAYDVCLMK